MRKLIIISIIAFLILLGIGITVYVNALKPVKAAEETAVQKAKQETNLQQVEDFHLYHGMDTYYVITGKDDKGTKIYVWVPEENGEIVIRKRSEGITEKEAVQKLKEEKDSPEIMSVRLGMENNIPLWEIHYRSEGDLINYYYVDFKTGEWLKKIENL